MNKRANKELFLAKIVIAIALVAIFVAGLWMFIGQDTIAVQSAKEAYSLYMIENPEATDKDFIYIYEDTVIVAIRNGKVVRKEYATEADAVKAALGSKDGANYSLAGTGNGKLFVVKLFEKTDDIYALGTSTLATGAEKLTIKVVSNGMIFATFEIPAEAIDRKQSPVGVTIKKINAEDYITLREDQGGFGYDIDVTNLVENNTARIAITINGPKGLVADANKSPITAYHKDKNIVSTYDAITGQISFSTTSFSPFPFVINNVVTVNSVAELREQLQKNEAVNITLGANIDIDLTAKKEDGTFRDKDGFNKNVENNVANGENNVANISSDGRYYSSGYYTDENANKSWLFFGAVVRGFKYLDLNGHTITYTGDTTAGDSALFCVDGGTLFCIGDESTGDRGVIQMGIDQYAVWAVESTSAVGIYGGVFVSSTYNTENEPNPNRALIYSSAGEIRAYGGYFLFKNSNYVDKLDNDGKPVVDEEGNPVKESKTNGGFNVLNKITQPRIWIHPGAYMSDKIYRQELDKNTIVLVGGKELYESEVTYGTEKLYTVKSSDLQVALKYTDKFLYRIGNTGSIPLKYLFKSKNANGDLVDADFTDMSVRVVDVLKTGDYLKGLGKDYSSTDYYGKVSEKTVKVGDVANGKFTFSETFTGLVRLDLYNSTTNAVYAQLFLEVVDGTNVTNYSQLKSSGNFVLLNDITLTADKYSLSNGTLYGNGYTFDVTAGGISGTNLSDNYLVSLSNAHLDNVQIIGPVYEKFSITAKNDYNRPVVVTSGTSGIYNSYISNAAAPVRLGKGNLTIVNTTLKGGSFANIDMRDGNLVLDDVTTINQVNGNDISVEGVAGAEGGKTIVGLGIVLWYEGANGDETIRIRDVNGNGTSNLKQYNYFADNQTGNIAATNGGVVEVADVMDKVFGINQKFRKTVDDVQWVNTGILSMYTDVGSASIDKPSGNYDWTSVYYVQSSNLCTELSANFDPAFFADPEKFDMPDYTPNAQYGITPKQKWDYPESTANKNYVVPSDDPLYCYYEGNQTIKIRIPTNGKFEFDPSILSVTKFGNTIKPTVTMDGVDYTGKKITFTEAREYTIVYTYTDDYNYRLDNGSIGSYPVEYQSTITVEVLVHKNADPATFDFNGNGYTTKTVGNTTYVMPNVSATSPTIGKTSSGIYYPIVNVWYTDTGSLSNKLQQYDGSTVLTKASTTYAYCPVFKGVITIYDTYNGNKVTYDSSNTNMANGRLTLVSDGGGLIWSNSGDHDKDPDVKDNTQFFASKKTSGVVRQPASYLFEYSYTDDASNTYHYYVKYNFPEKKEPEGGGCVTPDTLITLADGTKKRLDQLTYADQLLAWDFKQGAFVVTTAAYIMNHGYDNNDVIELTFSDGSVINVVNVHGFFDADLNKWVDIDAENAKDFIGHSFTQMDGDSYKTVKLTGVNVWKEYLEAWSLATNGQYNCILNGMFTVTPSVNLKLAAFDIGEDMKYDAEAMAADIQKYGLFTYEEFAHMMSRERFEEFNVAVAKVAMGKGLITYEEILELIRLYA